MKKLALLLRLTTLLGIALVPISLVFSDDEAAAKGKSAERLKLMSSFIEAIRITPDQPDTDLARQLQKQPILQYSDSERGLIDATVWKAGESGRPQVIITVELSRFRNETGIVTYEFLNLAPPEFQLQTLEGWKWTPATSALELFPLRDTPEPASKAARRAEQTRELARRFTARQKNGAEDIELPVLPQPADEYTIGDDSGGAMFVFAHGKNPEILLFVEYHGDSWKYGWARLSAAELTLSLDGEAVQRIPAMMRSYSWLNNYTANRRRTELP